MQRFEITVTERDHAPVDHPAASKCKCKCLDASGGAIAFAPDVRGGREGGAGGQPALPAKLSPLGD
jgi:hypothetical protein